MVINNLKILKQPFEADEEGFLVQNICTNQYYRLGARECKYLLETLDEEQTIKVLDISGVEDLNEDEKKFMDSKFQEWCFIGESEVVNKKTDFQLKKIVLFRFNVEKMLKVVYPIYSVLFSKIGLILLLFFGLMDISYAVYSIMNINIGKINEMSHSLEIGIVDILFVVIYILINIMIHELAHAVVCTKYGGNVKKMGILLYYLVPAFFCDVSSVYEFKEKKKKALVALAGVLANIFVALLTIFVIIYFLKDIKSIWLFRLLLAAIVQIFMGMYNLIPFVKLDGYWFLQAISGVDNLMDKAVITLYTVVFRRDRIKDINVSSIKKCFLALYGLIALLFTEIFWLSTYSFIDGLLLDNQNLRIVFIGILISIIITDICKTIAYYREIIINDYERLVSNI